MRSEAELETLKAELLALHQAGIQAHLDKDVDFFLQDIAPDYLSVGRGDIRRPTADAIRTQFSSYLGNTDFSEYADLSEPIVGISADGSMGWLIAQVKVSGQQQVGDGSVQPLDFVSAWLMLYERRDDRWVRLADVSTFR
ncbi:MAG: nuclear transport factor 2 family protein [Anaerolineales bacterium]|nr:nuclear transport factor 2 family protein [Anaerolineales bacterium]MCB0009792.1 nuclear transport factor 2 family protein [Anaerolineales bacterium]MCB0019738.1 nuclear transport factor 2 family protein [Anaerolineales bacterium]MCB8960468.1 nuclear transport factor 2 family protein [Ardenticatenales bacterium]